MERFAILCQRRNVEIRSGWLANDVAMAVFPDRVVISYCSRLPKAEAVVGVALMLAVLELGWQGARFWFRFPLPDDNIVVKAAHGRRTRDYRPAARWAARYLVPAHMIEGYVGEGRDPMLAVEDHGLTPDIVRLGIKEWMRSGHGPAFCRRRGIIYTP